MECFVITNIKMIQLHIETILGQAIMLTHINRKRMQINRVPAKL